LLDEAQNISLAGILCLIFIKNGEKCVMKVTSEDPRWPGYIVLPEYMNFDSLVKWENALGVAKSENEKGSASSGFFEELLPIACSIITEWHIEGLPDKVDKSIFPASHKLIALVTGAVSDLYTSTNSVDPKSLAVSSTTVKAD
jgi:hypothetical protein